MKYNIEDRGEYPKIERYKIEKTKKLEIQKTLSNLTYAYGNLKSLAELYPKYKVQFESMRNIIEMLQTDLVRIEENLIKFGQPRKENPNDADTTARIKYTTKP